MRINTTKSKKNLAFAIVIFITCTAYFKKADTVIQIDIGNLLNARPVTTLNNGKLLTWTKGVDSGNGYLTIAAAKFNGESDSHALPNNPLIAASSHHPNILLHYSNSESLKKSQARCITDTSELEIKIPKNKYSDLYLCFTSAYGSSLIQIEIIYKDGKEIKEFTVPDWYNDIPENDTNLSYVIHDLGKWNIKNVLSEKNHHNIDALNIHPNPARILTAIKLKKGTAGYLVFWAATGVAIN